MHQHPAWTEQLIPLQKAFGPDLPQTILPCSFLHVRAWQRASCWYMVLELLSQDQTKACAAGGMRAEECKLDVFALRIYSMHEDADKISQQTER